jgi:hypothetical protein
MAIFAYNKFKTLICFHSANSSYNLLLPACCMTRARLSPSQEVHSDNNLRTSPHFASFNLESLSLFLILFKIESIFKSKIYSFEALEK